MCIRDRYRTAQPRGCAVEVGQGRPDDRSGIGRYALSEEAFLAAGFFAGAFFAVGFLAGAFLAGAFFAAPFAPDAPFFSSSCSLPGQSKLRCV